MVNLKKLLIVPVLLAAFTMQMDAAYGSKKKEATKTATTKTEKAKPAKKEVKKGKKCKKCGMKDCPCMKQGKKCACPKTTKTKKK